MPSTSCCAPSAISTPRTIIPTAPRNSRQPRSGPGRLKRMNCPPPAERLAIISVRATERGWRVLRRTFLSSAGGATGATPLQPRLAFAQSQPAPDWNLLRRQVGNRLLDVRSPLAEAARNGGAGADKLFAAIKNPYYLSDEPSLTQSLGWMDAWTSQPSLRAVAAESAADVAAAINFARTSGIPPVVKGGGHSYFGNSNRADSLLIWTHRLRSIEMHDAFRRAGSPARAT